MLGEVTLNIMNQKIDTFSEYSIESDLYVADNAFSMTFGGHLNGIVEGDPCTVQVDKKTILKGIVDRITRSYDKGGRQTRIEGRDLMGIVVDSYCETFPTLKNKTLKQLAEIFLPQLADLDLKRFPVKYNNGADRQDKANRVIQIEPGSTVFDVLKDAALARGLLFYTLSDGTFVFGKPTGRGDVIFSLICKQGKNQSQILSGECTLDCSRRYSTIKVVGQQQGFDDITPAAVNVKATVTDSGATVLKTYVEVLNNDSESPAKRANSLLEQQRARSRQVTYKVAGHYQGKNLWDTDFLCQVDDDELNVHETMLIYSRKFTLSKESGWQTEIRLGPPGVAN
jgi:prophage tail gpP-like protein